MTTLYLDTQTPVHHPFVRSTLENVDSSMMGVMVHPPVTLVLGMCVKLMHVFLVMVNIHVTPVDTTMWMHAEFHRTARVKMGTYVWKESVKSGMIVDLQ